MLGQRASRTSVARAFAPRALRPGNLLLLAVRAAPASSRARAFVFRDQKKIRTERSIGHGRCVRDEGVVVGVAPKRRRGRAWCACLIIGGAAT